MAALSRKWARRGTGSAAAGGARQRRVAARRAPRRAAARAVARDRFESDEQAAVMGELERALHNARIKECTEKGHAKLQEIIDDGYDQLDTLSAKSQKNVQLQTDSLLRSLSVEHDALEAKIRLGRERINEQKKRYAEVARDIDDGRNAHLFFKNNALGSDAPRTTTSGRKRRAPRTYNQAREEDAGATGRMLAACLMAFTSVYLSLIGP